MQGEIGRHCRRDGDGDIAIPRVARLLLDIDRDVPHHHPRRIGAIEVHCQCAGFAGIKIAAQRGDQAGNIGRAAGAVVPLPAPVVAMALQHVLVEIVLAVTRYA